MPQDTRGRLLAVALELFYREGSYVTRQVTRSRGAAAIGRRAAAPLIDRQLAPAGSTMRRAAR